MDVPRSVLASSNEMRMFWDENNSSHFSVIVLWSISNLNQETGSTSEGIFERKLNLCVYLVEVPYYMYILERSLRPLDI